MAKSGHFTLSHGNMPEDRPGGDILHERGSEVRRVGYQILAHSAETIAARVMTLYAAVEK